MQKPSSRHDCKQWLADNGISDKSYYYWLLKIRLEAYEQLNVPAVTQSTEVSFAEIPLSTNKDHSADWNESVSKPVAIIKCGNLFACINTYMMFIDFYFCWNKPITFRDCIRELFPSVFSEFC